MKRFLAVLVLLGLAVQNAWGAPPRPDRAVETFHCDFGNSWDPEYVGWPKGWTRQRGPGYPKYVRIGLSSTALSGGGRVLEIELDGGCAAAMSPAVPVTPLSAYVLEARVSVTGLHHDRAFVSLAFFDAEQQQIAVVRSEPLQTTKGYVQLCLPAAEPPPQAVSAKIGLHVEPTGADEDLQGTVRCADVWLGRLPRLDLALQPGIGGFNLYSDPATAQVTARMSGLSGPAGEIVLQLLDDSGKELERYQQPILPQPAAVAVPWKPRLGGPGFYRLRAELHQETALLGRREASLAVLDPAGSRRGSDFGWSLPQGDRPCGGERLADLLAQAGVGSIKYPLGQSQLKAADLTRLAGFAERLNQTDIEMVGILAASPPEETNPQTAAMVFSAPEASWYANVEPLLARLATQVRWWQIGGDRDTSLFELPDAVAKVVAIKAALDRIGSDVNVGVCHGKTLPPTANAVAKPAATEAIRPTEGNPEAKTTSSIPLGTATPTDTATPKAAAIPKATATPKTIPCPWRFESTLLAPGLSDSEVRDRLARKSSAGPQLWAVVEGLQRDQSPPGARIEHLARRMILAKASGADRVFFGDPFDARRGLIDTQGGPTDLFVAWRVTAAALAESRYLGCMDLPNGSRGHAFLCPRDAALAVWNEHGAEETVYLGDHVRQMDAWGKSTELAGSTAAGLVPRASTFRVERTPTFLLGLDPAIVRWHLGFALVQPKIPSTPDQTLTNGLVLTNPFPQAVSGTARLRVPNGWQVEPKEIPFQLAAGAQTQKPLEIVLPIDALAGRQSIEVDFEITAERTYRFSTSRPLEVGMGDILVDTAIRLNTDGELEVEVRLTNDSDRPLDLRCELVAPDRRRLACQVLGLDRQRRTEVFRYPEGQQLLGKPLWLRVEEIDGPRVLNYRLDALIPVGAEKE